MENTCKKWLEGGIPAIKECFSDSEWEKLKTKRKEIYIENIDRVVESLIDRLQKVMEDSLDEEVLIRSSFESLKRLLDTSHIHPRKDNNKLNSEDSYRSIQFMNFVGEYDQVELLECYHNVIKGKHPFDTILYSDNIHKGLFTNHLRMHIYAAALHELYKYIKTKYIKILNPEIQCIGEKIKWLGSPSQFAYLFLELIDKGFIEMPIGRGNPNYAKLARMCLEKFQIKGESSSLTKELTPKGNSLEPPNRIAFKIPDIKDLS